MNENKFDGKGKIYAKYRPNYPAVLLDLLRTSLPPKDGCTLADVGSGTGILTRRLLECGYTVHAVEPNADMRGVAEAELQPFAGFHSVNGAAEDTTLENESVHGVTAAQSFHWFDPCGFKAECRRILKPGGMVALVWNSRDEASALVREIDRLNRRFCPGYTGFSGGLFSTAHEMFSAFFEGAYETHIFQNPLYLDEAGFIGRHLSASYALKPEDGDYAAYGEALSALFCAHSDNGILQMPNITRCYIGKP